MVMKTDNVIYPELDLVFLRALNYPEYARPEYYIKEQAKSGWSKGVFLRSLLDIHEWYSIKLRIRTSQKKRAFEKENRKLPEDFGLDLEEETNGEVKGKLTKKVLEDLRYAVQYAYKFDKKQPEFDSYQILTFCERILQFIKAQFNEQIQKTSSAKFLAEKFRKEGQEIDGNPEYVIYSYDIISDAPVANIYRFRNEVRKLLLNSSHPEELKTILKPLEILSVEIVNIWNTRLQPIEVAESEEERNKHIRDRRLITFDPDDMKIWHHNIYSPDDFHREPSSHFLNQDFAKFAANVANLITGEVLKNTKTEDEVKATGTVFEDLDELFIKAHYITPSYLILKDEVLIGDNNQYIGNLKSAFCVWAIQMRNLNIIHPVNDGIITSLLNKKFQGLNMNSSNFRTSLTKAKRKYENVFKQKLKKLSQP